jgi:hypothetical protein
MLPDVADAPDFLELTFADGRRGVVQPYAGWIIEATGGNTGAVTFEQAMKLVNERPLKETLREIEGAWYERHFNRFGG